MILSKFSLEDKVAIVTGSGRGIGKGIALGFAQAGAHVVTCSRTAEQAEATAAEIRALGRRSIAVPTDVRESVQVENLAKKAMEEFGRIDILVNNAGGSFYLPALELSERAWDALIRENLKPVFICSKAVVKVMIDQKKGAIINISSVAGTDAISGLSAYGASKAGIVNLTKTLAMEWAPYNIRINCIAPGFVASEGFFQTTADPEALRVRIPLGRFATVEDIALPAIFLASDASDYITGETIVVKGGPRL